MFSRTIFIYLYQYDLCQPPLRGINTNKIIFNLSPDADVGGKIDTPEIGGGFGMGVGIDMGADIDMPETDIKVKAESPDFG